MFTLTLVTADPTAARSFRVRKSNVRNAWKVAVALAKRHQCAVDVFADARDEDDEPEHVGQAEA